MRRAFLGLGSNVGDRPEHLRRALEALAQTEGIVVRRVSSFYETEPWGMKEQPWFLNAVAEIETSLPPETLLATLQRLEEVLGRQRRAHWGPREIDLDLLWYEGETRQGEGLTLPHPRIGERAFVLLPWAELAPEVEVWPGQRVQDLLAKVDTSTCRLWKAKPCPSTPTV